MERAATLLAEIQRAGIVETHYHVGPELLPRRYQVAALAELARTHRAAIVLKNHTYPTTPLAALGRHLYGAELYGSVVLNHFVGGLNPDAVAAAISGNKADVTATRPDATPIVVWMPTVHAAAHLRVMGHAFDPRWSGCCAHRPAEPAAAPPSTPEPVHCFDDALRPLPSLLALLDAVAAHGCTLATGHLSAAETRALVPLALARGVPRVILTHPHYPCIDLADEDLAALTADPRVFAEHCFAIHTIEQVPLDRFATAIAASPPHQVILSTDFGQIVSDPFPEGTLRFAEAMFGLLKGVVSDDELVAMFTNNGRAALGLARDRGL
jgi:hypothetical protein